VLLRKRPFDHRMLQSKPIIGDLYQPRECWSFQTEDIIRVPEPPSFWVEHVINVVDIDIAAIFRDGKDGVLGGCEVRRVLVTCYGPK